MRCFLRHSKQSQQRRGSGFHTRGRETPGPRLCGGVPEPRRCCPAPAHPAPAAPAPQPALYPLPILLYTHPQLYNGSTNPYFLAARRLYDQFWGVMRSSILPSLEAAGIVEPKL